MRHRYVALADGEALRIVVVSGAGQQDIWRQSAVLQNPSFVQQGRCCAAPCGRHDRQDGHGTGRFLPTPVGADRKAKAVTATARKVAVLFYNTLRYGMEYVDPGAEYYEERYRQRVLNNLTRRTESLGFVLQAKPA
jgi:hypothetical protein